MTTSRLSGIFLGDQSLLRQCAERFMEQGHEVVGIASTDPAIREWATKNKLPVFEPGRHLTEQLAEPFDYLFSIANLSILPAELLRLPRRAAINFHDGPLPDYAGLNTPSWALINREETHGVTWHEMTEGVDKGDILKQVRFPIAGDDTALTLNARCYEAALASFSELIDELTEARSERKPQELERRRYYGKGDRPAAAGSIDWSQPAEDIAALLRALDFGPYPNRLSLAKLWLGDQPVVVKEAEVLPSDSVLPVGTITHISAGGITVATGSFDLLLSSFSTPLGKPLTTNDLSQHFGLREGAILTSPSPERREALTGLSKSISKHESFWAGELRGLEPVSVPYLERQPARGDEIQPQYQTSYLDIPSTFLETSQAAGDELLAAFALYLARIGAKTHLKLHFQDASLQRMLSHTEAKALFASHVPLGVTVDPQHSFAEFNGGVQRQLVRVRKHGTYAFDLVQRQPDLGEAARYWHSQPTSVALERVPTLAEIAEGMAQAAAPDAALTLVIPDDGRTLLWHYRQDAFSQTSIQRMQRQFIALLADIAKNKRVTELSIVSAEEAQLLQDWNTTQTDYPRDACIHTLFEAQVARTPERSALVFGELELSYADLNIRANQLAHYLSAQQIQPGSLIGVMMDRSAMMLISMLGILKAGCAYVPLDPSYPRERLAYMVEDAQLAAILTETPYANHVPNAGATIIAVDALQAELDKQATHNLEQTVASDSLAYVIYTSGSTGNPKGVMIEHRNVVNFFAGMDAKLTHDEASVWLAVTSISFDISVLELFWTLTRGFKVVLYSGEDRKPGAPTAARAPLQHAAKPIDFSLFYFASDEGDQGQDKYRLLIEGAKYADRHGFSAVWTPERHFHAFGGLYPNPSVAAAALATITENIRIRAGSCVLPLHSPIRIAEEWALVDNLSGGRVDISFASGWQPDDFAIAPQNYAERHQIFAAGIDTVQALWRGESRRFPGPKGEVEVRTLPRPIQAELPVWVTAAGNPETFRQAGAQGANLLTHLLGQSAEELADKISIYRQAWRSHGHEGEGQVTLMLHSFVADNETFVRSQVREPLKNYLRSATGLIKQYASSFPTFRDAAKDGQIDTLFQNLSDEDMDALVEHAFERYYRSSGLFGTPESCQQQVDGLKGIGVDEIACLIDFGVPSQTVLEHLPYLNQVRELANMPLTAPQEETIPELLERHEVTHLQCTPSLASMLVADQQARHSLTPLKQLLVGGEAFPTELAAELHSLVSGEVLNMYGPTETTIWSSVYALDEVDSRVPIGRPIANTQLYVLDDNLQPVPFGVAGELLIGGDGVVRGYLNRPGLTQERFIASPFGAPGARLYRTGDLARYRPDGNLEFLGRIDHQIKLRGHRIELGEIETLISRQPSIQQAVVIAREDIPGDMRLVAYVQPQPGQALDLEALKHRLAKQLPEFMLPADYLVLPSYPLTPNGKIDRKALPAPERVAAKTDKPQLEPQNELERTIAAIWQEMLNLPAVGIRDNFFDSGGHSLLAVRTLGRLRETVTADLQMTDLFRYPTIQSLAQYLSRESDPDAVSKTGQDRASARKASISRLRRQRQQA